MKSVQVKGQFPASHVRLGMCVCGDYHGEGVKGVFVLLKLTSQETHKALRPPTQTHTTQMLIIVRYNHFSKTQAQKTDVFTAAGHALCFFFLIAFMLMFDCLTNSSVCRKRIKRNERFVADFSYKETLRQKLCIASFSLIIIKK